MEKKKKTSMGHAIYSLVHTKLRKTKKNDSFDLKTQNLVFRKCFSTNTTFFIVRARFPELMVLIGSTVLDIFTFSTAFLDHFRLSRAPNNQYVSHRSQQFTTKSNDEIWYRLGGSLNIDCTSPNTMLTYVNLLIWGRGREKDKTR